MGARQAPHFALLAEILGTDGLAVSNLRSRSPKTCFSPHGTKRKRPPIHLGGRPKRPESVERVRNRGELGVQLGANRGEDRDADNGDQGGDQTVFDRGRAGLIFDETGNKRLHDMLQSDCGVFRSPGEQRIADPQAFRRGPGQNVDAAQFSVSAAEFSRADTSASGWS